MYPESHWNYRVVRKRETVRGKGHVYFGIYEVHYKNKKPCSVATKPIVLGYWEDVKYLKNTARMIRAAFRKPVLDFDDFNTSGG